VIGRPVASPPRQAVRRQIALSWGGALLAIVPAIVFAFLIVSGQSSPSLPVAMLAIGLGLLIAWRVGVSMVDRQLGPTLDRLSDMAQRAAEVELPYEAALPRLTSENLTSSFGQLSGRLAEANEALRAQVARLAALNQELLDARGELLRSERLATVGRLAAGLGHEIGNPLGALLGFIELAKKGGGPEVLEALEAQAQRIHRTVQELMDFARPGKMEIVPVPLGPSIEAALRLVRAHPRWRSMELHTSIPDDLPEVLASEHHLVQVLVNLLLNAADACEGRGRVDLQAIQQSGRVALEVSDDGPGLAPEMVGRVFEPFATTKALGKGTGLGLAICRQLMQAFGGDIEAAPPTRGQGAVFKLDFRARARGERHTEALQVGSA
jgi:two-component system, NtrC family, sensor kinase